MLIPSYLEDCLGSYFKSCSREYVIQGGLAVQKFKDHPTVGAIVVVCRNTRSPGKGGPGGSSTPGER